jgi:RHS repeat-associated protein
MAVRLEQGGALRFRKSFVGEALWKREDPGAARTTYYLPSVRVELAGGVERLRKYYGGFAERDPDAGGALRFYHADHLGSATLVTDATGAVVRRASFQPWGEDREIAAAAFDPKYQFNFKEREQLDPSTTLYDYGARLYNPSTGRWLSADTVDDGLNRYAYVANNPLSRVDPTGHEGWWSEKWRRFKEAASAAGNTLFEGAAIAGMSQSPIEDYIDDNYEEYKRNGYRIPTKYYVAQMFIALRDQGAPAMGRAAGRRGAAPRPAEIVGAGNAAKRRAGEPLTTANKVARKTETWADNRHQPTCLTAAVQNCIRGSRAGYETDIIHMIPMGAKRNDPRHAVARFHAKGQPTQYLSAGKVYTNLDDIAKDIGYTTGYTYLSYPVDEYVKAWSRKHFNSTVWPAEQP